MFKLLRGVPPKVGSKWTYASDKGNPFCETFVIVEDVKHGFVKYKATQGGYSSSLTVRNFRICFAEVPVEA